MAMGIKQDMGGPSKTRLVCWWYMYMYTYIYMYVLYIHVHSHPIIMGLDEQSMKGKMAWAVMWGRKQTC